MPKAHAPHRGSMGYWPRVTARRAYPLIKNWMPSKEVKPLGFAGYKAGMTHLIIIDNRTTTLTKGQEISIPVTVVEVPPMKVSSIRCYRNTSTGFTVSSEVSADKVEKELSRKVAVVKTPKKKIDDVKLDNVAYVKLVVYTQPKNSGVGKKKPEVFEIAIGGSVQEQFNYAKNILGKEIRANDFFKEGSKVDVVSITKGKGVQGPHRRFGVSFRQHKSEKAIRNPANVGPWTGPASWRVAHAGKTGFYQRTELNKWVVKLGDNPKDIIPSGGFPHYGTIKGQYVLIKGSLPGAAKRLVVLTIPRRVNRWLAKDAPEIVHISTDSKK